MDPRPDAHRQAAHVFLDVISAVDGSDEDGTMVELAFQRMNEVAPVTGVPDEAGAVQTDVSTLVHGALIVIQILLSAIQADSGEDDATVIQAVRARIDDF